MESKFKQLLTHSFKYADKDIGEYKALERNMFALGMFGQNLIYVIVNSFLSAFYTDVLYLPELALLIITIVSRIWDAINDLLMGTLVDKTHSRWGKCRPYLKYAPIPIAIFTALMFLPIKDLPDATKLIIITITWLSWEALYTIGDIPLWGMTSLMTDNVEKRTKLVSLARLIGGCSVLVTFVFKPLVNIFSKLDLGWFDVSGLNGSQQQGYFLTVTLLCLVGMIFFKLPFIFTRERVKPQSQNDNFSFKDSVKLYFSNKYYLKTMLAQILGCAKGLGMSIAVQLTTWVFAGGNSGAQGLYYILFLAPSLLGNLFGMVTANYFEKKFEKVKMLIGLSLLCVIPFVTMFFSLYFLGTSTLSIVIICICQLIGGMASGFPSVYFTTMIADSIDYKEYETGKRYDGVYLSGLNFISKFNNAVVMAITYGTFFIVGYTDKVEYLNEVVLKTVESVDLKAMYPDMYIGLIILATIIPAISCILQTLPLWKYGMNDKQHQDMVNELIERRKKA